MKTIRIVFLAFSALSILTSCSSYFAISRDPSYPIPRLTNQHFHTSFPEDMPILYSPYDNTGDSWLGDGVRYYVYHYEGADAGFAWKEGPDKAFESLADNCLESLTHSAGSSSALSLEKRFQWNLPYRWFYRSWNLTDFSEDMSQEKDYGDQLYCYYLPSASELYLLEGIL